MFDTKIAIVVRDDLATWQKLNVTAFLTSGVLGANAELLGEDYEDADGNNYAPLIIQPMIVLSADGETLKKIHARGLSREARMALYIEDMFATGHDAANRDHDQRARPRSTTAVAKAVATATVARAREEDASTRRAAPSSTVIEASARTIRWQSGGICVL